MKRILVPIDFSDNTEKVISAAKLIAKSTDAKIIILYVSQPYIPDISIPLVGSTLSMYEELEQGYDLRLKEFVKGLEIEGYDAESRFEQGTVSTTVKDVASELSVDLIVVGRTGTGTFLDKLFGSNATEIVLESKCPVLLIPFDSTPLKFDKLLYATQLEYDEEHVLKAVKKLAKSMRANLNFVKINDENEPNIHLDDDYIDDITDVFDIEDDDIVIRNASSVIRGLVDYYEEIGANLLVVASRPRGLFEQYLTNPSMTKKLVLKTHYPILVYHLNK